MASKILYVNFVLYYLLQSTFQECLVDARMLEHISKKEYQKYLKVVDGFHRFVVFTGLID